MAELMLCSDGGAMHLAAAQAVPIVALFGNSDPRHWHPWGTRYEVLREASHDCNDITVERVVTACEALLPGAALSP
jgi:ADP-heptose:LPS heptosyltransferase